MSKLIIEDGKKMYFLAGYPYGPLVPVTIIKKRQDNPEKYHFRYPDGSTDSTSERFLFDIPKDQPSPADRKYKEVFEMPENGRFSVVYMYGEDLWGLTLEWDGDGLFELDENGEKNYNTEYSQCEFSQGRFFIEIQSIITDPNQAELGL